MNKSMRWLLWFIFLLLCFTIFYYSWLPQPSFKSESYMPNWLVKWTDEYGTLRTGVPFLFLGANAVLLKIKRLSNFIIFTGLFVLLFIAELGQLFLPNRHFDVWDIIVGSISIWIGIFVGRMLLKMLR